MRTFLAAAGLLIISLISSRARADVDLWNAELRVAGGIAHRTDADGTMSTKASPMSVAAIAAWALADDPPVSGYGGVMVETRDHSSVGGIAGVEIRPYGILRATAGAVAMLAPKSLYGVSASAGACKKHVCGDLLFTQYVGGDDLAKDPMGTRHGVTELQLAVSFVVGGR